ncbi:MAG: BspA family leucine-rich repeat surface protein [Saprospiraceae bacterium]
MIKTIFLNPSFHNSSNQKENLLTYKSIIYDSKYYISCWAEHGYNYDFSFFILEMNAQNAFITTWKTDHDGISNSTSITIPIDSTINHIYNYDVDWNNDGIFDELGITSSVTHNFGSEGIYTIQIRGDFPRIYFNNEGDKAKILDISQWGDIEWKFMTSAFKGCENLNISATDAPDLSNITSLQTTFSGCTSLNANIENWNVGNISNFYFAFASCSNFNQPLDNWDMSSATNLQRMFIGCSSFNQPLNNWDVSNVTHFGAMFSGCSVFDQPLNNWDVSNGIYMGLMFTGANEFNGDITNWNIENAVSLKGTFQEAYKFNQDISNWNIQNVKNLSYTFKGATVFNQDIGNWDVSQVTKMEWIFAGANDFNQDIGSWDVSQVVNMNYAFFHTYKFNQDISNWNTSNVISMQNMFNSAIIFNQDIGNWNVGNVTGMNSMFEHAAAFDQDIGNWDVSQVTSMTRFLNKATLSTPNYDSLLIGWNNLELQDSLDFHGGYSIYCEGGSARANMITVDTWTIEDGGSENISPVVLCQDIELYLEENGVVEITAEMLDNGSYDFCTEVSFFASKTIFDCNDIGVHSVMLTVLDENGNSDSCDVTVEIYDTPFNFICPSDMTVSANSSDCMAQVFWTEPQENCGVSFSSNFNSGDIFPLGKTTVLYQIMDINTVPQICTFEINVVNDLEVNVDSLKNLSCFESQDGEIFISANGGEAPYDIIWDQFSQEEKFKLTDLPVGNYSFQVTDVNGCNQKDTVEIIQPPLLELSADVNNSSSPQINEIDLTVIGGTPPYLFDWSMDGTGDYDDEEDASTTVGGTFTVSVMDHNGCTEFLGVTTETLEVTCEGENFNIYPNPNDGEFSLVFENCLVEAKVEIFDLIGRKIYTFQTSELENDIELEALSAGKYFLKTITDKGSLIKPFEVVDN